MSMITSSPTQVAWKCGGLCSSQNIWITTPWKTEIVGMGAYIHGGGGKPRARRKSGLNSLEA